MTAIIAASIAKQQAIQRNLPATAAMQAAKRSFRSDFTLDQISIAQTKGAQS
jgi:hypothetical protein